MTRNERSIVVILDDEENWGRMLAKLIAEYPPAADLEVVRFTSDEEATEFVLSNAPAICGLVQDLNRSPMWALPRDGHWAGVRFLDEVVGPYIPWARIIIVSMGIDIQTMRSLYSSTAYEIDFLGKLQFSKEQFWGVLDWLLEARIRQRHVRSGEPAGTSSGILEILDIPWQELRRYLAHHPEFLHTMQPRSFEGLVAEIFRSYGWEVELTAQTRDGGYDIIAVKRQVPSDLRVLAEAKRLSPDRPVGVEIVRALYGTKSLRSASQVVLATSSFVSGPAKAEFARVIPWELDFLERDKILSWCREAGGVELLGDLPPPLARGKHDSRGTQSDVG